LALRRAVGAGEMSGGRKAYISYRRQEQDCYGSRPPWVPANVHPNPTARTLWAEGHAWGFSLVRDTDTMQWLVVREYTDGVVDQERPKRAQGTADGWAQRVLCRRKRLRDAAKVLRRVVEERRTRHREIARERS
jgi:hypothetical protein